MKAWEAGLAAEASGTPGDILQFNDEHSLLCRIPQNVAPGPVLVIRPIGSRNIQILDSIHLQETVRFLAGWMIKSGPCLSWRLQ
jgi:hypothetical protein